MNTQHDSARNHRVQRYLAFGVVWLLTATAAHAQSAEPVVASAPNLAPSPVVAPARVLPSDPANQEPLEEAIQEFERTGHARILSSRWNGETPRFPFGFGTPTLFCARLRGCVIELEPGEVLTDEPLVADRERWIVTESRMGAGGMTPLIVVKPENCNQSTNLNVPTDRRLYTVNLEADLCRGETTNPRSNYTERIGFWYPEDMVRQRARSRELAEIEAQRNRLIAETFPNGMSNCDYRWTRDRRVSWSPQRICDDGVRTYIQLDPRSRHGEMPVLFAIGLDGKPQVLNYAIEQSEQGDLIKADRVLYRAELLVGTGKAQRKLELRNNEIHRRERGGR